MIEKRTVCEQSRIELFFRQQLSEGEQASFESHLEVCPACRQALELQAARAEETRFAWATQAREKFLAAGGTPYEWELAQENLWQQELARRVQTEQGIGNDRIRANVRGAF